MIPEKVLKELEEIYNDYNWDTDPRFIEYSYSHQDRMSYVYRLIIEVDNNFYRAFVDEIDECNMSDFEDLIWYKVKPVPVTKYDWELV